jgi:hypothetical protein
VYSGFAHTPASQLYLLSPACHSQLQLELILPVPVKLVLFGRFVATYSQNPTMAEFVVDETYEFDAPRL